MLTEQLKSFYLRDLKKLSVEISGYKTDEQLWNIKGDIKNPGGNLALHLIGNLNHFIGAVLGGSGYTRDRDAEFSQKNTQISEIISSVEKTSEMIENVLSAMTDSDLDSMYPLKFLNEDVKTGWLLIHLLGHLNYHLGQINYHRRMTE